MFFLLTGHEYVNDSVIEQRIDYQVGFRAKNEKRAWEIVDEKFSKFINPVLWIMAETQRGEPG